MNDLEPTTGPKPPSERELAAIAVAVEAVWPKPTVEEDFAREADSAWKFANRWWNSGSVIGRGRPKRPGAF